MKQRLILVIIIYLVNCLPGYAQTTYNAGYAQTSIAPAAYPFSLSLAGYGAPRDGRFSLEWISNTVAPQSTDIAGFGKTLFLMTDGQISKSFTGKKLSFKSIGNRGIVKVISAAKNNLFAIDGDGNLLSSSYRNRLRWKKIGFLKNAIAIAALGNKIFVVDSEGVVNSSVTSRHKMEWRRVSQLPGIISVAAYKNAIYVLTAKQTIFKFELIGGNSKWLMIARYNGLSYDVKLRSIAVANETLFGLDSAGTILNGAHQIKGDLSATALAVGVNNTTVILASIDVCGFNSDFINAIKQTISHKHHIPASAILINASHTHFAPVTQQWLTWGEHNQLPDSSYLYGTVRPAIIKAIENALKNMAPSNIYFGRGKTAIGGNRSLKADPVPYDNDVDVLTVVRNKDKKKTILFLTGCHAVFRNEGQEGVTISSNYPGITRASLRKETDIENAMFIQGCGGDINPVDADHVVTGEKLAADVRSVINKPLEQVQGKITFFLDSINFKASRWTAEQIIKFREDNRAALGDVYAEKNVRWADLMLKLYKTNRIPATLPVYIQTINIGDWKIVGLSREAVTEYSLGIKQLWPQKMVSVAGYCNDVSSYLPTVKHTKAGVYEGVDSFFWYGQPSGFPDNVFEIVIETIKNQNR